MYPQNISPSFTLNVLCVGVVVEDSLSVLYCLEVMHVIDDVLILPSNVKTIDENKRYTIHWLPN